MKEILIINLTRMGDLLQTTPLMAGFKESEREVRITLLINSSFAGICKGIPFIDELIIFDMQGFRERLLKKEYSLVENFRFIEGLIEQINKKEYDLAMNLTHSPISALITSSVMAKEIRGFTIDSEGHRTIKHPWLRYFFNVIPNRDYNPFHLVDMYLKAGGVMPGSRGLVYEISGADEKKSGDLLKNCSITENNLLIGIHLGASKSDKTWPVSSFADLADMISKEFGARILLFGSPSEADFGSEFEMKAKFRPLNFIGKTGIGELSALLKKCSLLISNDTGPLHLATAVGTKVLDISTANVHFLETGPYGEGHYVIQADLPCVPCDFSVQCNNMVCKGLIKPRVVFEVVKKIIDGRPALSKTDSLMWNNIQVYKTHFKNDGFLGFSPLHKRPLKKEIFYRVLYREVWNRNIDKKDINTDTVTNEIRNELSSFYLLNDIDEVMHSIERDMNILVELSKLAREGHELTDIIAEEAGENNPDVKKLQQIWGDMEAVDRKIGIIGHTNPCFRPFTIIFAYSKEALEGNDLLMLSKDTCSIYKDLLSGSAYMLQLMKKLKLSFKSDSEDSKLNLEQIHGTEYTVNPA